MAMSRDQRGTNMTAAPTGWNEAQRQAALDALARQFRMTVTEEAVFQAATLFFALLRDGAFVEKGRVVVRMQEELARAQAPDPEATGRPA